MAEVAVARETGVDVASEDTNSPSRCSSAPSFGAKYPLPARSYMSLTMSAHNLFSDEPRELSLGVEGGSAFPFADFEQGVDSPEEEIEMEEVRGDEDGVKEGDEREEHARQEGASAGRKRVRMTNAEKERLAQMLGTERFGSLLNNDPSSRPQRNQSENLFIEEFNKTAGRAVLTMKKLAVYLNGMRGSPNPRGAPKQLTTKRGKEKAERERALEQRKENERKQEKELHDFREEGSGILEGIKRTLSEMTTISAIMIFDFDNDHDRSDEAEKHYNVFQGWTTRYHDDNRSIDEGCNRIMADLEVEMFKLAERIPEMEWSKQYRKRKTYDPTTETLTRTLAVFKGPEERGSNSTPRVSRKKCTMMLDGGMKIEVAYEDYGRPERARRRALQTSYKKLGESVGFGNETHRRSNKLVDSADDDAKPFRGFLVEINTEKTSAAVGFVNMSPGDEENVMHFVEEKCSVRTVKRIKERT